MNFEFGLLYSFRDPPRWRMGQQRVYDETFEHIAAMENAGFDTIWVTEHHFSEDGYLPSLAVMSAAIAARTRRVRVAQAIVELPMHHPVRMAEDIAVADIISAGRMRMGVGLGRMNFDWRPSFEHEGLVFGASNVPRERVECFEEQVEILRKCWKNEAFEHCGKHYRFPEIDVTPKPVQLNGPEIWFGVGDHAKKALDRAARMADGWVGPEAGLVEYLDRVEAHGRKRESGKAVVFMHQMPARDPEAMEARYAEHLAYIAQWYNPNAEASFPAPEGGWFAEPQKVARDLDALRAQGATGALWFAPFAGISPVEAIPAFASIIEDVKPLMREVVNR